MSLSTNMQLTATCLVFLYTLQQGWAVTPHPDTNLTVPQMIARRGYPVESHNVTTADGYVLKVFRMPRPGKKVVFLQHGLLSSAHTWVITGPGKGPAYLFWEAGYDVWMGNSRGNVYSKAHTSLKTTSAKFWSFSFHEMGVQDLPAVIDYILAATKKSQLNYVGHSLGTSMFFVMAAQKPEYNAKVAQMHSLSTVVILGNVSRFYRLIRDVFSVAGTIMRLVGLNEFLPSSELLTQLAVGCQNDAVQNACFNIFYLLNNHGSTQQNTSLLPLTISHYPAGTSTKNVQHLTQQFDTGTFRQFDYGSAENLLVYLKLSPPEYNLAKVTVPTYLHYSDNDTVPLADVTKTCSKLANCKAKRRVPFTPFVHGDFTSGMDVKALLYDYIISVMGPA